MRKNYQMWLLGALFGGLVLPFAGCSNEDDPTPNGPGSGEDVKTALALVVTGQVNTKAAAEEMDNQFDGMTDIHLLSFADNTTSDPNHYVTSTSNFVSNITLADFTGFNITGTSNIKIYDNVNLPRQAVNFMFYGKNAYSGYAPERDLTVNYPAAGGTADDATFTLKSLTTSAATTGMTDYIQGVMDAAVSAINSAQNNETLKAKFKNYVENVTSPALYQVGYMMAQLYFDTDFAAMTDGASNVWDVVKSKIAGGANFVFNEVNSPENISALMQVINKDNEKYLGADFPIGGKTLSISVGDGDAGALGTVTVSIKNGENEDKYKYPTPLYFMANTYPVVYDDETDWDLVSSTFENFSTSYPSKIALKDQIEFAVGKLALEFNVSSNIQGSDPVEDFDGQFNQSDFEVVGILLNTQNQVGWNFLPGVSTDGVVYDNVLSSSDLGMLALATPKDAVVKFALEVKNKSAKAFKGVAGGIIPGGATFYVSGELNPKLGSGSVDAENAPAVFSPDYETKVRVTLTSLENAENTVPDLNAANLELALSVDLEWKEGYTFGVTIP